MKSIRMMSAAAGAAALMMTTISGAAIGQPAADTDASATAPTKVGPRLAVEPASVELGQIADTVPVVRSVTLTNTGDETLRIPEENGMKGSCGCTVPVPEKFVLEPGESMEIEVTFDPRNRSGKQNKTITISSNAAQPTVIPVNGTVIQRVQVVEGLAQVGRVDQGDSKTIEINIRGMDKEFEVTSVSVDRPDAYKAEIVDRSVVTRDDPFTGEEMEVGQTTVAITILDGAPVGRVDSFLTYATTDPVDAERTVRIAASVSGDIRMAPGGLRLGMLQPGDTFEESVDVYSNKNNSFSIQRAMFVSSDLNAEDRKLISVTHEPLPVEDGRVGYRVTMSGEVTESMRLIKGRLVIMTDWPGQKVISGAVQGVVRTAGR